MSEEKHGVKITIDDYATALGHASAQNSALLREISKLAEEIKILKARLQEQPIGKEEAK